MLLRSSKLVLRSDDGVTPKNPRESHLIDPTESETDLQMLSLGATF